MSSGSQLTNPYSSGGGGSRFENQVQTAFVCLMLAGSACPGLAPWPIRKIKLQGKHLGYETDDFIVFASHPIDNREVKLLAQIKHSVSVTKGSTVFRDVIHSAWRDFSNVSLFTRGVDQIALISGPLSKKDTENVRSLLEWARDSESAADFITRKVHRAKFSSRDKREKLDVFRAHLSTAKGEDISDDELWRFMRSYHLLGYDLDIRSGVALSLLHALIRQGSSQDPAALWARLSHEVKSSNQNAGTISIESLPNEISKAFREEPLQQIPKDIASAIDAETHSEWKSELVRELAQASLVGSWNEQAAADRAVVENVTGDRYNAWIQRVREVVHYDDSPLKLDKGVWSFADRLEVWNDLGSRLFDDDLDRFQESAITVLSEEDPQFELPQSDRFQASILGKRPSHSESLRHGVSETLALLRARPEALPNCSPHKAGSVARGVVRVLLRSSDWITWASLNAYLPSLAEAAPIEFLECVEQALEGATNPFLEVFAQEGTGVFGTNYTTGLLWALEGLAWHDEHLSRAALALGGLAEIDPGGTWANRPINSLVSIFLPWLPQTTASIETRIAAVSALHRDSPNVAWALLIQLLPNQRQHSSGTRKPRWLEVGDTDRTQPVSAEEYWMQINSYIELTVELSKTRLDWLTELVKHLNRFLDPAVIDSLIGHIESPSVASLSDVDRYPLWQELKALGSRHRAFPDAKWAFPDGIVNRIESAADHLEPADPFLRHRRLFSSTRTELFEERGNWKRQEEKLLERRIQAVHDVVTAHDFKKVVAFSRHVEDPFSVGYALGALQSPKADGILLPNLLEEDHSATQLLLTGFVRGRHLAEGWSWLDELTLSDWPPEHVAKLYAHHRFCYETWQRVVKDLGVREHLYWRIVSVAPYEAEKQIETAIRKLLQAGRPRAAINCFARAIHEGSPIDPDLAVRALLEGIHAEDGDDLDFYTITKLVEALQNNDDVDKDDLLKVEWAVLPLFDDNSEVSPTILEHRLADDPNFFCELIHRAFRSDKEESREPTDAERSIAINAYRLLHIWQTPPGAQYDGDFSEEHFHYWLSAVKSVCSESGHLKIALQEVGKVLIHSPEDPSGLWIHGAVAEALNARDAMEMRLGFRIALFNSRGVSWVDPSGAPELKLAAEYRKKADSVEKASYPRLAATLRELADTYEREAQRIIEEHKEDDDDESHS